MQASSTDVRIVSIHAGLEFLPAPSPHQVRLAELCLASGANLTCFHHAHVCSGVGRDGRRVVLYGIGKYAFPDPSSVIHPRLRRASALRMNAAVWRVRLDASGRIHSEVSVSAIARDEEGFPVQASSGETLRLRQHVDRCSRRLAAAGSLAGWRWREMLRPAYVGLNLDAYRDLARRIGVRAMLRRLAEGIQAQFGGKGE